VDAALRHDPVAWLSSVQADGRPHVVPVWFAQRFAEVYSQPIVLRPTRFLGYGGRGWQRAGALAT